MIDLIRRNGWRTLSFPNAKAVRAFSATSRLTFEMEFRDQRSDCSYTSGNRPERVGSGIYGAAGNYRAAH